MIEVVSPTAVITKFRKKAAITISMIMPVVFIVFSTAVTNMAIEKRPRRMVSRRAAKTPRAADSVAVAQPI